MYEGQDQMHQQNDDSGEGANMQENSPLMQQPEGMGQAVAPGQLAVGQNQNLLGPGQDQINQNNSDSVDGAGVQAAN